LQPPKYSNRRHWQVEEDEIEAISTGRGVVSEFGPYVFGGLMLIAAFAFAGNQLGRNASAHNSGPDILVPAQQASLVPQQSMVLDTKGSLLPEGQTLESIGFAELRRQSVVSDGKGDLAILDPGEAPAVEVAPSHPKPILKPAKKVAELVKQRLHIEPAAVNLQEEVATQPKPVVPNLALAPKPDTIEKTFKLPEADKKKVVLRRRIQMAEENCLARAVYFEARSESEIGQMAVAKVILNRVKSPHYAKSICGVVYQGSNRRNSCQFSFACDGQPDDVRQPAAWAQAKSVAQRAIAGDTQLGRGMNYATSYHADYVTPRWAKSLRKVVKIGRHIFYSGI
jgi:spore germination cell wall hydrolase CwlJ-like protein